MYTRYDNNNRDEYYEQFTFPKTIMQLQQWQRDIGDEPVFKTNGPVRFRNIDFGSSKKIVYQKNGKPRFLRLNGMLGEKKHEIAFYKELLNDHKLISQLHFFDDLFFYGCHTFRYLPREKFSMVKKMLAEKYCLETDGIGNANVFVDEFNNQIRLVDNVFLNLVYLSGDEKFKTLIEEFAKEYTSLKKKNQKSLLTELYGLL